MFFRHIFTPKFRRGDFPKGLRLRTGVEENEPGEKGAEHLGKEA